MSQRSFAQKLNRIQASDMRKQVSISNPTGHRSVSVDLTDSARPVLPSSSQTQTSHIPVYDVAEPVDFEDFVSQRRVISSYDSATSGTSSPRRLQEFPSDDIEVKVIQREPPTVESPIPTDIDLQKLDSHTKDVLSSYNSDLVLVQRRYEQYSSGDSYLKLCAEKPILSQTLPRQNFEIDLDLLSQRPLSELVDETPSQRASYASRNSSDSASTGGDSANTAKDSSASVPNLQHSVGDPTLPGVTQRVSPERLERENETRRWSQRHQNLLNLFPLQHEVEVIELRNPSPFPLDHQGQRLLIRILGLNLGNEFEPIFASLALYEATARRKVSENFYFDMNSDSTKAMLRSHIACQDASSLSRGAVLNITHPTKDMYIVVKLEKVLQACDITEAIEPYVKDDKNRDKLRSVAYEYCERLGAYRMPIAWTMIDLSKVITGASSLEKAESVASSTASTLTVTDSYYGGSDTDSIVSMDRQSHLSSGSFRRAGSGRKPATATLPRMPEFSLAELKSAVTLTVNTFFKQESEKLTDEDLYKHLQDAKKASSLNKKLKCIPGCLKLEISPCPEDLNNRLSPEFLRLHPFMAREGIETVKELVEFPLTDVFAPNCTYRNLLYIYPKSVNFSSRPGSVRNISVKVELLQGQDRALPVIFGKSSCPEFSTFAYSTVSYHNKAPQFYDEVKAKLPIDLSDAHHLLFTFYHISCRSKPSESAPIETPIGYSWMPLYRDKKIITGEFNIPISLDFLPQSYFYLSPEVNLPNIRWLDSHKATFSVQLILSSTIHTQDVHLDNFLRLYHITRNGERSVTETELQSSIQNLTKARPEPLVKFLYILLDKLIDLLVNPTGYGGQILNVGQTCFEIIGQLVKIVTYLVDGYCDQHGRSSLLTTFIHYHKIAGQGYQDHASHFASCASFEKSKSVDGAGDIRRTASQPEVVSPTQGRTPDTHRELLDIIKGFERASSHKTDFGGYCGHKLVHEELALNWVVSTGPAREMAFANSWFFLELLLKSMSEYLASTGKLYLPRKLRLSDRFIDDVTTLCTNLTSEVVSRCGKDMRQAQNISSSLAFFLRDSLSLMDRTYVLNLIRAYCKQIAAKIASLPDAASNLMLLKLEFLRIIVSHEHFLILNLPFGGTSLPMPPPATQIPVPPSSPSPSLSSRGSGASLAISSTSGSTQSIGAAELTTEFRSKHFLVGLVLADLSTVLETSSPLLHGRAIGMVRNLLSAHDADPRIGDVPLRAKVAALYLPLVGIVLDACTQIFDPYARRAAGNNPLQTEEAKQMAVFEDYVGPGLNPNIFNAIAGETSVSGGQERGLSGRLRSSQRTSLSLDASRQLLASFCWVLKNMEQKALKSWIQDLSPIRITQLLDVLQLCVSVFEYKGTGIKRERATRGSVRDLQCKLEDTLLGKVPTARNEMLNRSRRGQTPGAGDASSVGGASIAVGAPPTSAPPIGGVRWRKGDTYHRKQEITHGGSWPLDKGTGIKVEMENDMITEGNLATEVSLVVLDTLDLILKVIGQNDHMSNLLSLVMRVLLHMLACNQSTLTSDNLFASQRALVTKYPELLFEEETEQCGDLCLQLLRHCAGRLTPNRSQSAASLYLLMRQSFESGSNFARVKMQVTVSLSTLVSSPTAGGPWFSEAHLRKSLKTVLTYAESDAGIDIQLRRTSFAEQVKDLVFNLHMILSDTVKMKEFQNDFEMMVDLMYRIAKGYQHSPDLRLTWLQNMAQKHAERLNFAEAAQCTLHAAALATEYMHMMEDREYLPSGANDFLKLSENILEESAVSEDVVSPEEEGICEGRFFTEGGLLLLLDQTAQYLYKAHMFEAMEWLYKIVLPILEEVRDYKRIGEIHRKLSDALAKVESLGPVSGHGPSLLDYQAPVDKRIFGTYFRVGFYGSKFGDLDGMEYVYKEPAITKLVEISSRLESFYSDRFGKSCVEVIKDSNNVDRKRLDSEKAYLQITYVEPHFDRWEMRRRPTHFERSYNVRRFVYATPFTRDGRAHGELASQWKRKTVLTTEQSFPYVKTRIRVAEKEQSELTPIEVAIEDIQKKTRELGSATAQEPKDRKILQMVLQGCIGTTVNQGPMEIANVFLSEVANGHRPMTKLENKLRLCFKDFSKKCMDALRENKRLIGQDQKEYQKELEQNYVRFTEKLTPMVANSAAAVATLKKQSKNKRESVLSEIDSDTEPSTAV